MLYVVSYKAKRNSNNRELWKGITSFFASMHHLKHLKRQFLNLAVLQEPKLSLF